MADQIRHGARHRNVRFPNDDGQKLAGILDTPGPQPRACALFAHCFTCSKNLKAATHIARALNDAGIAVLRFDFTGLGESEGDFADTSFSNNVADLVAAARFLGQEYAAPGLLVGHSLGGTAMLLAAADIPSAGAVATIAAPSHPSHIVARFDEALADIESEGKAMVTLDGRTFTIRRRFLEDLERHPLPGSIAGLRKAFLILHSPRDETVSIDHASELFLAAKHPKSFLSLDQADHLLSKEADSRYAGLAIAAWADRYLPAAAERSSLSANAGEVAVRTAQGFTTEIDAAGHPLVADEPVEQGGDNLGPTPYDLLAAALASCTSMTLRMYADHKKLDLDAVAVRVSHSKIHARDCEDCETRDGRIDEFRRSIALEGTLSNEVRQRLLEIADKCPVHRTLHGEVKVRTRLDD
jgi:putative redox protein